MPVIHGWFVAVDMLLTERLPPTAFCGMYEGSVLSVGPEARLARRTCCQNSSASPVGLLPAANTAPSITPLPLPLVRPVVGGLVSTWATALLSSPGSARNLSWYA